MRGYSLSAWLYSFPLRVFLCMLSAGITLYAMIAKQNELVAVRLEIPSREKELRLIEEENVRLKYEIERFESPIRLMELAKKAEFSHLKFPHNSEVLILPKPPPLLLPEEMP